MNDSVVGQSRGTSTLETDAQSVVRFAGILAIAVSVGLLIMVLWRDVGLNALNGFTIVLGALGGALGIRNRRKPAAVFGAGLILLVAAAPALFGGMGLLFFPSILLMWFAALALARDRRRRR